MLDFILVTARSTKKGVVEVYPKFIVKGSTTDLMIRGGDFYAIWDEENSLWSTREDRALYLIDQEVDQYAKEHAKDFGEDHIKVLHMWDAESGMIDKWHKYVQKQMRDSWHLLDEKIIFSNTKTKKEDYASKRLNYPIEESDIVAYDELIGTLYSSEERKKIEWAVGSIVSGDSVNIQKFLVMYGAAGTGKSTILNIIQEMFEGYSSVFDAKALGNPNNTFALEPFKSNPLVAIQHDGDLSKIEDNTRLNSVVSHELMTVNEKFKSTYSNRFRCFLFMGTNKPVRITDAKSGIIRRLIDVSPTGKKIPITKYKTLLNKVHYELGGIAAHCRKVYEADPNAYDDYIPTSMLGASNDFYNYVLDSSDIFKKDDGTTLKAAWELYKTYCEYAKVPYPYSQRLFKEELKNYFKIFKERDVMEDGSRVRNVYQGFIFDKFLAKPEVKALTPETFEMNAKRSLLDDILKDCPAQYANEKETPISKWANVTTTLKDISTSELHYVKVPKNHIVIDFDLKDKDGNKSFELNSAAASKWPSTYAEVSKGGNGIHLHYIYNGDVTTLAKEFSDNIEIKVFSGDSSLRRKVTKCNDIPVATLTSGLPQKEKKVVSQTAITTEKSLRKQIIRNLKKEIHPATKPSVDFIFKILEDAYNSDLKYDVSDLRNDVMIFASGSSHNAQYCMDLVTRMHFASIDPNIVPEEQWASDKLIFFDVEVFPNLFVVCWKTEGKSVVKMINPSPEAIRDLCRFRLVGFNNRLYDNHILYARMQEFTNEMLFDISQRIINKDKTAMFREAYALSYTDIYDFSSKKQSLKKFEIELGIHHQELGLPWDKPVDEKLWTKVADYCVNDVIATEEVFKARKGDFVARQILAALAQGSVNDTTNQLTTKIIFGNERKPYLQFNYRNLGGPLEDGKEYTYIPGTNSEYTVFDNGKPIFPGYVYSNRRSIYRGVEVGEGGRVSSRPGMYFGHIITKDVASQHPNSILSEEFFGAYTKRFRDLVEARIAIKHKDFEKARAMLDGKLAPYLESEENAKMLTGALKIAINSVYGLTAASFDNPFKDPRNVDNFVAKRGSLFMVNLENEVIDHGGYVAHVKTDSIKLVNPTDDILQFVYDYGQAYGYTFETEHIFDRICLVNDAVYIAKCADSDPETPGKWTATGAEFQHPYIFKTLFTKEPIEFEDLCETKSVKSALYLDMCEGMVDGAHNYQFVGKVGQFCPMKPGCGGGYLMREQDGKYYAATGTKGYLWMEAEMVKTLGKEGDIDFGYFEKLAADAKETINKFGDFEQFVNY